MTIQQSDPKADARKKCQCYNEEGTTLHTCPFAMEIGHDDETLCNCCEDCTYQCVMDI